MLTACPVFSKAHKLSGPAGGDQCQGIGNLLIHGLIALPGPVNLVEDLPVFNKQYPLGMAGGVSAMGDHQDGLAGGINVLKKL